MILNYYANEFEYFDKDYDFEVDNDRVLDWLVEKFIEPIKNNLSKEDKIKLYKTMYQSLDNTNYVDSCYDYINDEFGYDLCCFFEKEALQEYNENN